MALAGAIIFTSIEFRTNLGLTSACFGGNSVALSSQIVVKYLNSLLVLYSLTRERDIATKSALAAIVNHILKNPDSLEFLVEGIFNQTETNLVLNYSKDEDRSAVRAGQRQSVDLKLTDVLKGTGNTLLMYKILLILLRILNVRYAVVAT